MSVKVMSWVMESSRAAGSDRLVLLAIADCADDEGRNAWPSIPTIAAKARVSTRTVHRSIESLLELGELRRIRGGGRMGRGGCSNAYEVVTDCHPLPAVSGATGGTSAKLSPVTSTTEVVTSTTESTATRGSRTIQNHKNRPSSSTEPSTATNSATRRVFDAWVASTGKSTAATKLTDKRRRAIIRALKDYPEADLLDAVDGWRHSAWHRGENAEHRIWNDLELILRDAAKIEGFRDATRHAATGPTVTPEFLPADPRW